MCNLSSLETAIKDAKLELRPLSLHFFLPEQPPDYNNKVDCCSFPSGIDLLHPVATQTIGRTFADLWWHVGGCDTADPCVLFPLFEWGHTTILMRWEAGQNQMFRPLSHFVWVSQGFGFVIFLSLQALSLSFLPKIPVYPVLSRRLGWLSLCALRLFTSFLLPLLHFRFFYSNVTMGREVNERDFYVSPGPITCPLQSSLRSFQPFPQLFKSFWEVHPPWAYSPGRIKKSSRFRFLLFPPRLRWIKQLVISILFWNTRTRL